MDTNQTPMKENKKSVGFVFYFVVGLIFFGVLFFMGMVGYYMWQIKYGDSSLLQNQFYNNQEINIKKIKEMDVSKYVRSYNPVWGEDSAPITILYFADFECTYCREAFPTFEKILAKYPRDLKVIFKNLPLIDIHASALEAALAGTCAHEQKKFWEYHDLVYKVQNLAHSTLISYAVGLGLDEKKFTECLETQKYMGQVSQDVVDASTLKLTATPSYFINGRKIEGVLSEEQWDKIISDLLKK